MPNENNDVNNPEVDSSTTSNEEVVNNEGVDSTSSTQSTETTGQSKTSLLDGIKGIIESSAAKAEGKSEEEVEGDESETESKPEEKEETEGEAKVEGEKQDDDKKPVPYDRFQEVIKEKNEAIEWKKQNEKAVEAYQNTASFLQSYGVSPEEYQNWMNIAALSKTDPIQAMERLQPYLQQLQSVSGEVLPQDLKEAVEAGHLTEPYAKELAKARGKSQVSEKQLKQTREQQALQQQQQWKTQIERNFDGWLGSKIATDPAMKQAQPGQPDGKFELVRNKILALFSSGKLQIEDPAEIVKIAEQAYQEVNSIYTRLQPKQKPGLTVRSSQSGTNNGVPQIKSIKDAVNAGMAAASRR